VIRLRLTQRGEGADRKRIEKKKKGAGRQIRLDTKADVRGIQLARRRNSIPTGAKSHYSSYDSFPPGKE